MHVLSETEEKQAVEVARHSLEAAVSGMPFTPQNLPPVFLVKRGVFVTLKIHGALRGCIGIPYPVMPLGEALVEATISACLQDPRFLPVTVKELSDITLEISVLSPPEALLCPPQDRPRAVEVGRHGLIVSDRTTSGLLLPQVPAEYGWNSRTFLEHTCLKAGLEKDCWTKEEVMVYTFEGQIFHE